MQKKFIRLKSLKMRFDYTSDSGIYDAVARELITKPVKISVRASGWPVDEIDAIIEARIAGATNDDIRALVTTLHEQRRIGAPLRPPS